MCKEYFALKTKKAKIAFIKEKLTNNKAWAFRALITIYKNQTEDEKACKTTVAANGMGFTAFDAEFLSSLAIVILDGKAEKLSLKCVAAIHRNMPKYAGQLYRIIEAKRAN